MVVGQIRELLMQSFGEASGTGRPVEKVKAVVARSQDRVSIEMEDGSTFDLVIHKTSERIYDQNTRAYGERARR